MKTKANMCAYGMTTKMGQEVAPALKPTSFMTNSPCIAEELSRRCENYNSPEHIWHEHINVTNGRAKAAQRAKQTETVGRIKPVHDREPRSEEWRRRN
eukprot:9013653-Karenia_brevis.AAC.1